MKNRSTIYLLGAIAILVLFIALKPLLESKIESAQEWKALESEIDRIIIEKPGVNLIFKKVEDTWVLGDKALPVDVSKVEKMIEKLKVERSFELRSVHSNTYSRFSLVPDLQVKLTAYKGEKVLRELIMGKANSSLSHTFVRFPEDPMVYETEDNLRIDFDHPMDDYRKKQVLSFNTANVQSFKILRGDKVELEAKLKQPNMVELSADSNQSEVKWISSANKTLKKAEVDELLSAFSGLRAKSFANSGFSANEKTRTIAIQDSSQSYQITLAERKREEGFLAKVSERENEWFLLNDYAGEKLFQALNTYYE